MSNDRSAIERAEEALRESERRYERVMLASGAGLWDWDVANDVFYVSPALLELCGFDAGTTFLGRDDFMRRSPFFPEDRERYRRAVHELFASGGSRMSMELRYARGSETRWVHLVGMCFRDASGKVDRWTGSATDVTERKQAEAALRLSEERYALTMEASGEGHFDWNVRTDEIFVSPLMKELLGLPADMECRTRDEVFARVRYYPGDRERVAEATRRVLAADPQQHEFEYRVMHGEHVRWLRRSWKTVRDEHGVALRAVGALTDITERKRAEEALRLSEERYALAMRASGEGHWDWKIPTDELYISPRYFEILGFPPETKIPGRWDWVRQLPFHPDDWAAYEVARAAHFAGDTPRLDMVLRLLRDGEVRWLHVIGECTRDGDGKPVRWAGSAMDITDRKRVEEALREQTERLQLGQAAMRMIIMDWNVAQDVLAWSDSPEWLRGPIPASGCYPPFKDQVHPEDRDRFLATRSRALEALQVQTTEFRLVRTDGEVIWVLERKQAFVGPDGKAVRMLAAMVDITDRKRIEDTLRSSEARFRGLTDLSSDWYWEQDEELRFTFSSAAIKPPAGHPGGSSIGLTRWELPGIVPLSASWEEHKALVAARKPFRDFEYSRPSSKDGSLRYISVTGTPIFDEQGEFRGYFGVGRDITEPRRAAEELRKMEETLRLARRLEGMGTLAGGIAHDFNNILGAVLGYGEMAMRSAKKGSRLYRDLASIMSAGERGRALVDRVLAFSRSGVADRVPVHVEAVVREVLDQVAARLPSNMAIESNLEAGRAAMLGDSTQVHQVVMNLASNGVQAMPHGGVLQVTLDAVRFDAPRPANIGTIAAADYIMLRVGDSGTGIAPDVLERMFDPFFTTKEVGVGSGLGLSLVHGIVTSVGGAIDVSTELGRGSTFTVYLPRSGDAAEKPADSDLPLPRGRGQCVLVVDDEEPLVRLTSATLKHLGYSPVGFTSSAAALHEFKANPARFDAILTDERMPGMMGSAMIREVRRIDRSIPILLMSGFIGGAPGQSARELGANDVLKKPVLAAELAASLARAIPA